MSTVSTILQIFQFRKALVSRLCLLLKIGKNCRRELKKVMPHLKKHSVYKKRKSKGNANWEQLKYMTSCVKFTNFDRVCYIVFVLDILKVFLLILPDTFVIAAMFLVGL